MSDSHQFQTHLEWPVGPTSDAHPDPRFSRNATLGAAGKMPVASSAPAVFGGDETRYNPEELLLMSLSQCHMLTYLAIASKKRIVVLRYTDHATGTLTIGESGVAGKMSMQEVVLHPRVVVARGANLDEANALHEKAHANCFIANSVNFPVRCMPEISEAD